MDGESYSEGLSDCSVITVLGLAERCRADVVSEQGVKQIDGFKIQSMKIYISSYAGKPEGV